MHDWTFLDIKYCWLEKKCVLRFKNRNSEIEEVCGNGVTLLNIPHQEEWGPSVSVNEITLSTINNKVNKLRVEMQSVDIITIQAINFSGIKNN